MRFGETTFARFISSAAGRMPRIVVKARLPAADVLKSYQSRVGGVSRRSRADAEALPDDTETDEHGAVYVWESRKAFEAFGASELARSIGGTNQVEACPQKSLFLQIVREKAEGHRILRRSRQVMLTRFANAPMGTISTS